MFDGFLLCPGNTSVAPLSTLTLSRSNCNPEIVRRLQQNICISRSNRFLYTEAAEINNNHFGRQKLLGYQKIHFTLCTLEYIKITKNKQNALHLWKHQLVIKTHHYNELNITLLPFTWIIVA